MGDRGCFSGEYQRGLRPGRVPGKEKLCDPASDGRFQGESHFHERGKLQLSGRRHRVLLWGWIYQEEPEHPQAALPGFWGSRAAAGAGANEIWGAVFLLGRAGFEVAQCCAIFGERISPCRIRADQPMGRSGKARRRFHPRGAGSALRSGHHAGFPQRRGTQFHRPLRGGLPVDCIRGGSDRKRAVHGGDGSVRYLPAAGGAGGLPVSDDAPMLCGRS